MQSRISLQKTIIVTFLIALGVIIPLLSPIQLVLEPASFTLALHVPLFIAMCISPIVTFTVAMGTALGFLIGDFPMVVVWRAASHVLFALLGSLYLQYRPQILSSFLKALIFSFFIGIIHAWAEIAVVGFFYMGGDVPGTYYTITAVFLLVGLGGLIHSMVDFSITLVLLKVLTAQKALQPLFVTSTILKSI